MYIDFLKRLKVSLIVGVDFFYDSRPSLQRKRNLEDRILREAIFDLSANLCEVKARETDNSNSENLCSSSVRRYFQ